MPHGVYGRLGDKTFGRQQLAVSATGVEKFGWQKWSVTPRTAAERGFCKRLSVFSCFGTHLGLNKVQRRSNTDLQTLKRLWSRLARRNPEQIFIAANYCRLNVQPVCPNGHQKSVAETSVAQTSCRPNVCRPHRATLSSSCFFVTVQLFKSKCLPILYYGIEVCPYNKSQISACTPVRCDKLFR